jgi:hypothetical protein
LDASGSFGAGGAAVGSGLDVVDALGAVVD